MRIGTWNLAGRWDERHRRLLLDGDCDVWLLTEVHDRSVLDGHRSHLTRAVMAERRRWAGVFSRAELEPLPDPHPASAMARVNGTTYCASVLPWRSCGSEPPWVGERHADKTGAAVTELLRTLPQGQLVWGGDWNHALAGREWSGSAGGRTHVLAALAELRLQVPTAPLPHRIDGLSSIDHIAVGSRETVASAQRLDAQGLSDHDAYVVELSPGGS